MSKHSNKSVKKSRPTIKQPDLVSQKIQELEKRLEELEVPKNKREKIKVLESTIKLLFGKLVYDWFTDT